MKYIWNTTDFQLQNTAVSLGKFDGFHVGHRLLIEYMTSLKKKGLQAVTFSFFQHPGNSAGPGRHSSDIPILSSASCLLTNPAADQQAHPRAHSCPRRLRRTTITTTCGRQGDTEETAAVSAPFWHLSLFCRR